MQTDNPTLTVKPRHPELPKATITLPSNVKWWGKDIEIDSSGDVTIAEGSHIAHRVRILTHDHEGLTGPPQKPLIGKAFAKPLTIGTGVFVGEGSVIMPQVSYIADHAVIGAYSVLTKNVGPGEVWAGNPAKFIKMREGMTRQTQQPFTA